MKRQIARYGRFFIAIVVLAVIGLVAGVYIAVQQRLPIPTQDRYTMKVEFSGSSGLEPGLGQPVNVAGVQVGAVSSGELKDGRSVVSMSIDPAKLGKIYRDAHANLIPNTPLKDLQIEIFPGKQAAGELPRGGTIPVANTAPPVDSDELTASLDRDTRDYFQLLVSGGADSLKGRGRDIRALLGSLGVTTEQAREVTSALAARRREMRRLVHNLAILARAGAEKDAELAQVVDGANATVEALASQEGALRSSIEKLPGTLSAARTSLANTTAFAGELGPTLTALLPTVRRAPELLRALRPLTDAAEPIVREQLRPFARQAQPLLRALAPTTRSLSAVTPSLSSAFNVLNYTVNELGFNPDGDDEGFLYWLAWFAHNGNSVVSTEDAHGAVVRGLAIFSCDSFLSNPSLATIAQLITGPLAC